MRTYGHTHAGGVPVELDSLQSMYVDQLKDLYSAENQILKALPRMIKAASHKELKKAFTTHERQTRGHVARLDRVFKELGATPRGKKCEGIEGIIREGAELIREKPEPDVLDAGLLSAAQHVEHYEMAGYGTVRTWAQKMGFDRQAELLQQTLDEEKQTDQLLTQIAEQSINIDAMSGDQEMASPADRARPVRVHREPSGRRPAGRSEMGMESRSEGSAGTGS